MSPPSGAWDEFRERLAAFRRHPRIARHREAVVWTDRAIDAVRDGRVEVARACLAVLQRMIHGEEGREPWKGDVPAVPEPPGVGR